MVHPTCALAHPPGAPLVGDNQSAPRQSDTAALTAQAVREINAVREAYHAAACIHGLVVSALSARSDELLPSATETRSLVALLNSEFERRIQLAKATITSLMQSSP